MCLKVETIRRSEIDVVVHAVSWRGRKLSAACICRPLFTVQIDSVTELNGPELKHKLSCTKKCVIRSVQKVIMLQTESEAQHATRWHNQRRLKLNGNRAASYLGHWFRGLFSRRSKPSLKYHALSAPPILVC
jgi:hypothetical protein